MASSRLTALDTAFLTIEDGSTAHMHVAGVFVFRGDPPAYEELCVAVERRLASVPRYRQRLHTPPLALATPEWVDDPHFRIEYHLRHTALPSPGDDAQLRNLAGRLLSQRLDRDRPLWEMWLVEGLSEGRFALISKTHHALVDGISGVDIATVLFDVEPGAPRPAPPAEPWHAGRLPTPVESAARALVERVAAPVEAARGAAALATRPRDLAQSLRTTVGGIAALAATAVRPAPPSIYNTAIGPHRRFTWVPATLAEVKAVKNALGGTVNDAVLAAVTGALRRHLLRRGEDIEDTELVAMVPVSVRTDVERGALGNRVSTMFAPLPVGLGDPLARYARITEAMRHLKEGGQAVGATVLTELGGLAPPTILNQVARLAVSPRTFTLTVTNVPGPQIPLYVLGRELTMLAPMVPLAPGHALGIAIISYNGTLTFGLVGDWDVMDDLDLLADDLRAELDDLAALAGRATHGRGRASNGRRPTTAARGRATNGRRRTTTARGRSRS